ncbi:MAG: G-D-S-L family lipolytic protein [Sphingobacteriales bacterium]|jgi:lysophospholipase L1-like esterase|nr:G-D-S-L family lipolytic protein [Sphingobacteriales bacterium]
MKKLLLFFFLFYSSVLHAQKEPFPFWNEVQRLKAQDSVAFPATNQILFIGSSSFTMWKDVGDYFPKYRIINRAFGGSQLVDLILYRYDVIYPYQPKQIVMYCGENDFAASDTVTADIAFNRFVTLFKLIRAKFPSVPFAYVSMKPSPSRIHLINKFREANEKIAGFLKTQKKTVFIDVFDKMLKEDGSPMDEIFLNDKLHMNAKGYAIWQKTILPYLKK